MNEIEQPSSKLSTSSNDGQISKGDNLIKEVTTSPSSKCDLLSLRSSHLFTVYSDDEVDQQLSKIIKLLTCAKYEDAHKLYVINKLHSLLEYNN